MRHNERRQLTSHRRVRRRRRQQSLSPRLARFVAIAIFLFLINAFTYGGYWWVVWPIMGMGLGITLQAIRVHYDNDEEEELDLNQPPRRRERTELPPLQRQRQARYDDRDLV